MSRDVVACSDTESLSISVVIKRGFAALRYLKLGKLITPEETIAIPDIIDPPKSARLIRNCDLLNILLTAIHATRNAVHPIRKNPLRPEINAIPVFSNDAVTKRNTDVKMIDVNITNLLSFLRNGSARNKIPIGNMKNWMPPHDAIPKASKIPAPTIFAMDIFPLSDFKPLRRR
jgi:hypothetical protein|tara:strand:- start:3 stop:524 length:522 start_codon:yes stop_codon:yes gene_type:complete